MPYDPWSRLLLRERYAGPEAGVAFWIMAIAAGAGLIALLE
jgi:hypothetical protein